MRRDAAVKARSTKRWSAARAQFTMDTRWCLLFGIVMAPAFLLRLSTAADPSRWSIALSFAITEAFAGYLPWCKRWELVRAVGVTMVAPIVLLVLVSERSIVNDLTRGAVK
jgi:ABC-type glycerol-3-phosphate transport system permease component